MDQTHTQHEIAEEGEAQPCQRHGVPRTLLAIRRPVEHDPSHKDRDAPGPVEEGGAERQDGHIVAAVECADDVIGAVVEPATSGY